MDDTNFISVTSVCLWIDLPHYFFFLFYPSTSFFLLPFIFITSTFFLFFSFPNRPNRRSVPNGESKTKSFCSMIYLKFLTSFLFHYYQLHMQTILHKHSVMKILIRVLYSLICVELCSTSEVDPLSVCFTCY